MTGSLIDSALSDCLIVLCTAGFSSTWSYLCYMQVNDFRNMAADSAALAEVRAGITLGVELYAPWDAPEAVVDILSEGVMPLRNIPDVIGLVGHREGAAESRVLQGPGHSQCASPGSGLSGSGPELSRCCNCRYGRGAGIVSFHPGVIGYQSTMAPGGPQAHGVASARTGRDAFGS